MEAVQGYVGYLLTNMHIATVGLAVIILTLSIKSLTDLFGRNPRHVKFARTLPGPPALPLVGNGHKFAAGPNGMKLLVKYEKEYGSMYHLWFGKQLVIGTTDIDFIETIFRNSKVLDKPSVLLEGGSPVAGENCVFIAQTHLWKKTRKGLQAFFTKNSVSEKLPQINAIVEKYVHKLEKHADGPEVDVGPTMDLLTFDIIAQVVLNALFECTVEYQAAVTASFREGEAIIFEKLFKPWVCNAIMDFIFYRKRLHRYRETTSNFFKKVMDGQMTPTEPKSGYQISFMQLLHQLEKALGLGENYVQDESVLMMAAGNVTTSNTASYTLLMLAMYPEIQEKVYAEIIEKLGPENREPDIDELNNLTYLEQVLKEVERRFLLIPLIFRVFSDDMEYGSHIIPAGTAVMIAAQTIHMSPKYYDNPEKFDPDHFSAEAVSKRPKLAFFPFSAGARNCLGKALAELELKLIVVNFLRRFKFSTNKTVDEKQKVPKFITRIEGGYMVKVEHRDQSGAGV